MWFLSNDEGKLLYLLKEKKKYIVGRVGADIILKNDTSVSRTHAILQFQDAADKLILSDSSSKYGTYVKQGVSNKKVNPGESVHLNNGDYIRFGILENEWKVNHMKFVSMYSSISEHNIKPLENNLQGLGGRIIHRWESECTHLTMTNINVTVKVLYALLNNIPIVSCEFWSDLINAIRKGQPTLPSQEHYLPKKSDVLLIKNEFDFGFRPERKTLFSGKMFVFLHKKHFEMYSPIVQMAGGTCTNLNSGFQKASLIKDNVVVVQYIPSTQSQMSQTLNNISDFLDAHSRRVVAEYEIGLAIINCSVEKYCNPAYKILSELIPATPPVHREEFDTVLVTNTNDSNSIGLAYDMDDKESSSAKSQESKDAEDSIIKKPSEAVSKVIRDTNSLDNNLNNRNVFNSIKEPLKRKRLTNSDSVDELALPEHKVPHLEKSRDKLFGTPVNAELRVAENDKKKKISTLDFLNKTHLPTIQKVETSVPVSNRDPSSLTNKRGRIAVITEDESDDENDLFNFGSSSVSKIKKIRLDNDCNRNEMDFSSPEKQLAHDAGNIFESADYKNLQQTQEYRPKDNQKSSISFSFPKTKSLPKIINTTGWFGRSKIDKDNIEQLANKSESKPEISNVQNSEYKQNLEPTHVSMFDNKFVKEEPSKNGFEVRFCLVKKLHKNILQTNNDVSPNNSSYLNFKVFNKKWNYTRQRNIIKCGRR